MRFEHAGRCRITASQEPTDAFTAATADAVVTIGKGIRTVVPPSGFTWVDLPQAIGVRPANAPAPTFSSLTTDICSVTADGVIDVPDPSEGRSGRCGIAVNHPGNADWQPVATAIDVEIGAPAVLIRLAAGQETSFAYKHDLRVTVLLDIVENDGGADVGVDGSDSSLCTVSEAEMDWGSSTIEVDVDFRAAGECTLRFFAFGPGVYSYNLVLPAPIVLTAR